MRPTIRQLEYVVAVAQRLHFRQAAKQVAVTQPALSTQIKQLESSLGVQIFERDRRRVLLTPAGEQVVRDARRILAEVDALVERARHAGQPLVGPLRLGAIPTIGPYLLPIVLPAVRARFPRLRLLLREDQTARLVEQLQQGQLDLLLLALPVDVQGTVQMRLFEEDFDLAVPGGHPLASAGVIDESDLDGAPVMLLEEGHCLRDQALSFCRTAGAHESEQVQGTSLGTLTQMVANGLGITLLPRMAVASEVPADGSVRVRRFAHGSPRRAVGLLWRASSARAADYRLLGGLIRERWSRASD